MLASVLDTCVLAVAMESSHGYQRITALLGKRRSTSTLFMPRTAKQVWHLQTFRMRH